MSNLIKPYTISVWDDVWDEDTKSFKERKYAIIGSDTMQSQNAVMDPILSRNVNGTKRLTFQLCKRYKDSLTGEQIINPFADYLISERKIKLKYDNKWYDFIVKNINEDSNQYIYTYTCEDAHVVELSKNGFDVSLNSESANNSDTLGVLAARVMEGTDWDVESEVPVQTLVENLVYVRTNEEISAIKIIDQNKDNRNSGVTFEYTDEEKTNIQTTSIAEGTTLLAFYSSCRNKPPHFQFIKLDEEKINGKQVLMDEDGVIIEENCQYYIEYLNASSYLAPDETYGFSLPEEFSIILKSSSVENTDTTISSWYKGARYNFSQKSEYEPKLKRYVNIYSKDGEEYRGYSKTEIVSPEFVENYVSNPDFKATSGWIGSWKLDSGGTSDGEKGVIVESAYGRFEEKDFISAVDDLGKVDSSTNEPYTHSSYLKVTFPAGQNQDDVIPCLINSGPYDFRSKIGFLEEQKNWIFELHGIGDTPIKKKYYNIIIADSTFDPSKNGYTDTDRINISLPQNVDGNATSLSFTVTKNSYENKKDFIENSNVRIFIYPEAKDEDDNDYPFLVEEDEKGNKKIVMYLKKCLFFKENRDESGALIYPLDSLPQDTSGKLSSTKKTEYFYYKRDELDSILEPEDFIPSINLENPSYDVYKPQFNMNAEKIRSVTVKESNFFNILQTLAETFEMWMIIEPEHDEQGNITRKKILFKKTIGEKNYANFRYGVNLKDIKRVYESKSLVTKLIVKQNSNEFAKNGFCTISRAASNPIGENVIYDFQYYFNTNLLNARDHLDSLYSLDGAQGEDIPDSTEGTNCLGYYPRMRALNDKMDEVIELSTNCNNGLITLKAKAEVQKQKKKAAESECAEAADTYQKITNSHNIFDFPELDEETKEKYLQRSDLKRVLDQYTVYATQGREASEAYDLLNSSITSKEAELSIYEDQFKQYREQKINLNKAFYSKYSRFIQEGTWINEEYVDDEKYYADAKSVLYNSCYPQVAYSINVLALSAMPGYELFSFQLGDQTYAEDPNFFGSDIREEVVLTEIVEHLSSPEKNSIKVQNFKNQFQDLFQKITATVQQAQYRTGSYEKAVALSEANQQRKYQFLTDALAGASAILTTAGQQTVSSGAEGLIITEDNSPNELRLIAGAILLKTQDENGLDKYVSALTTQGFSANLITAGSLNTGSISIMNGSEPTFRWDSFGISAFSFVESEGVISDIDSYKFVRMDKYGIYGINTSSPSTENSGTTSYAIDGTSWHATSQDDITNYASFALTWEGLKVVGATKNEKETIIEEDGTEKELSVSSQIVAKIGKNSYYDSENDRNGIISVVEEILTKTNEEEVKNTEPKFLVYDNGDVYLSGEICAITGNIGGFLIANGGLFYEQPASQTFSTRRSLVETQEDLSESGPISPVPAVLITPELIGLGKIEDASGCSYAFQVNNLGELTARSVNITGGTMNICGNFIVDPDGNVTLNGNITWGSTASPTQVVYARTSITKPSDDTPYSSFDSTSDTTWHQTFDTANDKFASYTYDGGNTWGNPIQVVGEQGSPGQPGAKGDPGEPGAKGDPGEDGTSVTINSILYASHSSATEPPDNGWRQYITSTSGTLPYLWVKTTYSDGKSTTICSKNYVTKNELWSDLGAQDGIYLDGSGNIKLRATAIISGALQVGGEPGDIDDDEVKFYAGLDEEEIKIGGFKSDYWDEFAVLYTGTINSIETVFEAPDTSKTGAMLAGHGDSSVITFRSTGGSCSYLNSSVLSLFNKNEKLSIGTSSIEMLEGTKTIIKLNTYSGITVGTSNADRNGTLTVYGAFRVYGTIGGSYSIETSGTDSDQRLKKNVSPFDERHNQFFDSLQPVRYKYIDSSLYGESYRSGFIAQEVKEGLQNSHLTPEDWDGLRLPKDAEDYFKLVYQEFIALNTWQIQKLKPRMSAAEQEIASLKLEIQNLRTELENLKKS